MDVSNFILAVVLTLFALYLIRVTVKRYFELPKREAGVYYTPTHKYLHYTLNTIIVLVPPIASYYAVGQGPTIPVLAFMVSALAAFTLGAIRIFMEWKHDENRILYKASLVEGVGSLAVLALFAAVLIEDVGLQWFSI